MAGRFGYTFAAIVALGLTGCGGGGGGGGGTASPSPQTINVQVDAKSPSLSIYALAYFPSEITAHPGDTVVFTSVFTGEPHTVTLGTLVDQGLDAYDKLITPANLQPDEASVPELAEIPRMLPRGPGDANQATAQPCYLDSGAPPGPGPTPCPKRSQPEFTGTQSLYNSGFLPDKVTFSVRLSSNIAKGSYRYFCALHREQMEGKITVVPASQSLPSADQVKAKGDQQLQQAVQVLQPAVSLANAAGPNKVSAGVAARNPSHAAAAVFAPKDVSIPVGGTVTWIVSGPHTITFNAPMSLDTDIFEAADGSVHLNPPSRMPAGGPGGPQAPQGPPPSSPIIGDGAAWNGVGLRSSGFIAATQSLAGELGFKLTFTTAGVYKYDCLIHPDMDGTITVT